MRRGLLAGVLLLLSFAASGDYYYRCVENGKAVLTNIPCRTKPATTQPATEETDDNRTAAQIQADFEREVAEKRAQEAAAQQAEETQRQIREAAMSKQLAATPPITNPAPQTSGGINVFMLMIVAVVVYALPTIIAAARSLRNTGPIIVINLLLGWTLLGWVVAFAWSVASEGKTKAAPPTPPVTPTTEEDAPDNTRDRLREEIRQAVAPHSAAVSALQALARIDGQTSEAERNIIMDFVRRHGGQLTEDHRPYFYGSAAGEWQRAIEEDEIADLLQPLHERDLQYRIALVAAASAIAASGGTPKRREAALLTAIHQLIAA